MTGAIHVVEPNSVAAQLFDSEHCIQHPTNPIRRSVLVTLCTTVTFTECETANNLKPAKPIRLEVAKPRFTARMLWIYENGRLIL